MQSVRSHDVPSAGCPADNVAKIAVVDDEVAIADLVKEIFEAEGMQVDVFYDPVDALSTLSSSDYDLVIADIMMPGMDGYELYARLRRCRDVAVIFLSAKDGETDIVVGFALGADDYVVKPFKPRELVARVKARLRRTRLDRSHEDRSDQRYQVAAQGIVVDTKAHLASIHDIELTLTPKEFDILALLLLHAGEPVASSQIYESCWHEAYDASAANTVMVHIRHLRSKLAQVDSSREFIETAWGVGYRIAKG